MKAFDKYIKVRVHAPKEVITDGGIIIPIEQGKGYAGAKNYQAQKYAPTHGEVVSIGGGVNDIAVGDTVMFHFTTEETCKQQGRIEQDGDNKLLYVDGDKVMCVLRGGNLLPINGWILANRAEKAAEKTDGGIIIPEAHRKESDRKFRVVAVPEGYDDVSVGDVIYTEIDCDIPLQANEFLGIVPNDLFRINIDNIVAKESE